MESIKENMINNCQISISEKEKENLLEQNKKNICKIHMNNGNQCTGFFCKIPFPEKKDLLPVLITNDLVVDKWNLIENKYIKLTINNEQINKNIEIKDRKIYISKVYEISIIELKEKDDIKDFLELESNDEIPYEKYIDNKLYIPQYQTNQNFNIFYSLLKEIDLNNNYIFYHSCSVGECSSGSPIINLENNKVIGISTNKSLDNDKKYNKAIFLKYPIKEIFIKNIKNEILIQYKINKEKIIRIFGSKFVENNKNNCIIIVNDKEIELKEFLENKNIIVNKNKILEIKLKEKEKIIDASYMFNSCSNIYNISNWDTISITNMNNMFSDCSSLKYLPDISNWNTQNVNDMSYMFSNCSSLKSLPDISKWNVCSVEIMNNMFANCSSLKSLPDISKWNTKHIKDMSLMFAYCSSLKSLPEISKWSKKGINFGFLYKCKSLPKLNISNIFIKLCYMTINMDIEEKKLNKKRLWNEFRKLTINPIYDIKVNLKNNDLFNWELILPGPKGSPYESGIFILSFIFPPNYPFRYPDVKFTTPILHPKINESGQFCCHYLVDNWNPMKKISEFIEKIINPLGEDGFCVLNPSMASEYSSDKIKFEKKIKDFIKNNNKVK